MKRRTKQSERNLLPIGIRRLKTRGVDVNHGILVRLRQHVAPELVGPSGVEHYHQIGITQGWAWE